MNVETISQTFAIDQKASLSLSNIRGKVNIQTGEDNQIRILAEKLLDSGDAENTVIEINQESQGRVMVHTRFDYPGFRIFRKVTPCKVNYEVTVPGHCGLVVRGVSNSARIVGISGEMDISTVSGDLELHSLEGEIKIKTVSGDIQAEKISGRMQLDTVSGDVHLVRSEIPGMRGKTVSGDIVLETPLGAGPYSFNAVSGDIRFEITPLSGATVSSSSLSGDLKTSFPVSESIRSRNHRQLQVKGGGTEIHHSSVSGDLFLTSADDERALVEPIPGETRLDNLSNQEILESIERGEVSVDEAVGMLNGKFGS